MRDNRALLWIASSLLAGAALSTACTAVGSRASDPDPRPTAETFSIYVLGGSVARGEPYAPRVDLGRIVSYLFAGRINDRAIDVINFGEGGKPAARVQEDVRMVLQRPRKPRAEVALLYLGNNEYLKYDTHHDLSTAERALFDKPTVTATARENVLASYKRSIDAIAGQLTRAGIPVIASTAAVNMKDWEPNRSVLSNSSHETIVRRRLEEAEANFSEGVIAKALSGFLGVLDLEPRFALACKRAGDCYRRLGDFVTARVFYQQAVDYDANPYRETSIQNAMLLDVCARYRVPVVDAARILEDASDDGLVGYNLMWDNCHPTLEGYCLIADRFAQEIQLRLDIRTLRKHVELTEIAHGLGIDDPFIAKVLISRGQYHYAASTLIWNAQERLARAQYYLDAASRLAPGDVELLCSFAVLSALKNDASASVRYWQQAYDADPAAALRRLKDTSVMELMHRIRQGDLAERLKRGRGSL